MRNAICKAIFLSRSLLQQKERANQRWGWAKEGSVEGSWCLFGKGGRKKDVCVAGPTVSAVPRTGQGFGQGSCGLNWFLWSGSRHLCPPSFPSLCLSPGPFSSSSLTGHAHSLYTEERSCKDPSQPSGSFFISLSEIRPEIGGKSPIVCISPSSLLSPATLIRLL